MKSHAIISGNVRQTAHDCRSRQTQGSVPLRRLRGHRRWPIASCPGFRAYGRQGIRCARLGAGEIRRSLWQEGWTTQGHPGQRRDQRADFGVAKATVGQTAGLGASLGKIQRFHPNDRSLMAVWSSSFYAGEKAAYRFPHMLMLGMVKRHCSPKNR